MTWVWFTIAFYTTTKAKAILSGVRTTVNYPLDNQSNVILYFISFLWSALGALYLSVFFFLQESNPRRCTIKPESHHAVAHIRILFHRSLHRFTLIQLTKQNELKCHHACNQIDRSPIIICNIVWYCGTCVMPLLLHTTVNDRSTHQYSNINCQFNKSCHLAKIYF